VAQRVGRDIALLFHDRDTRRAVSDQQHAQAALYPRKRPGTHFTGGWVGPRAGLDRCGKSRPHRDSIPDRPARSQSLYRLSYRNHRLSSVPPRKCRDINTITQLDSFQKFFSSLPFNSDQVIRRYTTDCTDSR